jgi:hypothetical protein
MGVGLVRDQVIGRLARPPWAATGHPDAVQQRQSHGYRYRAVAADAAVGDDACVTHDGTYGPLQPPSDDLLDLLHRIADHDDAPDAVQADARDYLQYLEDASSGSGSLTGEARLTMAATAALWHGREVVQRVPRPQCGTI